MQDFDTALVRAHRRKEAEAGFPLLRGCPSTGAIARLTYLDALSDADRINFSEQLSDLAELQKSNPDEPFDTHLSTVPLVQAYFAARYAPAQGVAFMPVKLYAGVCKDTGVGGFAGWAKMVAMPVAAQIPAAAHAASLTELIPVAPRRLRKLIDAAMTNCFTAKSARVASDHTRYSGSRPEGNFTVDVTFPRGMGPSQQFSYDFSASTSAGRRIWMKSYEGIWRLPSHWDYITETNAEVSVAHFMKLIEACVKLG